MPGPPALGPHPVGSPVRAKHENYVRRKKHQVLRNETLRATRPVAASLHPSGDPKNYQSVIKATKGLATVREFSLRPPDSLAHPLLLELATEDLVASPKFPVGLFSSHLTPPAQGTGVADCESQPPRAVTSFPEKKRHRAKKGKGKVASRTSVFLSSSLLFSSVLSVPLRFVPSTFPPPP